MIALAGTVTALAGAVYKLLTDQVNALRAENETLRNEAKEAVKAKDSEIASLRDLAAKLAEEHAEERRREAAARQEP